MTSVSLEEQWAEKKQGKLPLEEISKAERKKPIRKPQSEKITDSALDQLPTPTGWRIIVLPIAKAKKLTVGSTLLAKHSKDNKPLVLGYVLKTGPLAAGGERFSKTGPWCKEGAGPLRDTQALELTSMVEKIKILNDDEIIAQ